ncbi:MAG TPA: PfkB family carbohydrate kinase [Blastocatellia bacterium]|nr:PfkB family carbohydrate kinase [Blastocatellia bacterium]
MKVTILEFVPCADSIYHVRRDEEEGYIASDERTVKIRSGAKLRPRAVSTYAGGKATNVARVMNNLLDDNEAVEIELVVFRPDSPEGRYIHDLQVSALTRVQVRPVIIEGRARICVDLTDPTTAGDSRVEFNISPRALWEATAQDRALEFASGLSTDLLLIAGNPPIIEATGRWVVELCAQIIEEVRERAGLISIDVEKGALANCLRANAKPDMIKINEREYQSVDDSLWNDFAGALVVTDASGCRVWENRARASYDRVQGLEAQILYSTIGAGDAMHAGLAVARWVWGFDLVRASRYGQATAAASVTSPDGTRGISRQTVERLFAKLETEEEGR